MKWPKAGKSNELREEVKIEVKQGDKAIKIKQEMDKTTEQIQTLTPHTTVIGSRPLGTKLYIYKHFQLIFSFTTVILVQTWLDSHICLIVKNPYVLVCKRKCS